jgi:4,5-dihydroxyphthalate decarboxylase
MTDAPILKTALKAYPHTRPLLEGRVSSPRVRFEFHEVEPIHRAFKPMAERQAYDVSELAVFTFLQAKAYDKPVMMLPVVLAARLQHGCLVFNTKFHDRLTPDMLAGKTIGVRAWSQTTGAWVRNILSEEQGIDARSIKWLTFEGAHLEAYKDPAYVTRAPEDKDLLTMLMAGEVDAAILGNDLPDDPAIKAVIPNAAEAGRTWFEKNRLVPINHVLTVTNALAEKNPDAVREIYQLFRRSKSAAPAKPGAPDMCPMGFGAVGPSLQMTIDAAYRAELIPRRFSSEELFADAKRLLGADA